MKRHGDYVPLTQEQITAAQHTDIAEFLRARGEKLRREGSHYIWKEHDSCVITGYMWYQNSSGKHGAAVSFVQHFFGMSFPQAVLALLKDQQLNLSVTELPPREKKAKSDTMPIAFALPPSAPDHRRLFAYLTKTRCISPDIVTDFLQDKLIYQDVYGNIVFVCYDKLGQVRAAHRRGTNTSHRYRGFVAGGDFACGFSYVCETADTLYVFEAPIDLMSYISLHRHQPWHKSSYLSLGGLADDALRRFLSEYPDIRKIVFCLDNDTDKPENWGQAAAQKYSRNYGKKRLTRIDIPCLKDWNAVLCSAQEERL